MQKDENFVGGPVSRPGGGVDPSHPHSHSQTPARKHGLTGRTEGAVTFAQPLASLCPQPSSLLYHKNK